MTIKSITFREAGGRVDATVDWEVVEPSGFKATNFNLKFDLELFKDFHGIINGGIDMSRSNGTIVVPAEAANSYINGGVNNQYEQSKNNKLLETYFNYRKNCGYKN